ncbi:MAG: hypothetical protein J7L73_01455, partial [Anaerolineales bacterium]|nr:hypothetical protein [Anaerolineales bacterium]
MTVGVGSGVGVAVGGMVGVFVGFSVGAFVVVAGGDVDSSLIWDDLQLDVIKMMLIPIIREMKYFFTVF